MRKMGVEQMSNLDISEGKKANKEVEESTSNDITNLIQKKDHDSCASSHVSFEDESLGHEIVGDERISEIDDQSEGEKIEIETHCCQSIKETEASEQSCVVPELKETKNLAPESNESSTDDYPELTSDMDEIKDEKPLLNKNTENDSSMNIEGKVGQTPTGCCIDYTKSINDSLVLAKELTLIKEHNSWETIIKNTGNVEKTIILKGSLDKYCPGFWPFRKGILKYQFNDPFPDGDGVLRMETKKRKWNSLSNQMTICKHDATNWKEIGNLGKTRRGYNVFDSKSNKLFKIRKIWKFLQFNRKMTYSVRKIVLKDDILGSGCGTIEVDDKNYPEPLSFKLMYSPSPGDYEDISLLVAVMFRMLIDSIVTL